MKNQFISNTKVIILFLLFTGSLLYSFFSMLGFVYQSKYTHTLSFKSLKLDQSKEYQFVNEFKTLAPSNQVIIPIGGLNIPDSLCTLYYDNEWKLKLTDNLRKSHKDSTVKNIMFPFCRLNERKNEYSELDFFSSTKIPLQNDLLTGIRFNNASGHDAFIIKLEQKGDEFFLTEGVSSFSNRNIPIANGKKNIIELDFNINGDTLKSHHVFAFPFFGKNNKPERKQIIIENNKINFNGVFIPLVEDSDTFLINDCVFLIKSNYSFIGKGLLLPSLYLCLLIFTVLYFLQLYKITNKTQKVEIRNLIKIEQYNILSLRILFNCIILLGFPILLLKSREDESRLLIITILTIVLNINWIHLTKYVFRNYKGGNRTIFWISAAIVLFLTGITYRSSNELVFGIVPVLKVVCVIFILLPFAISAFPNFKSRYIERIKHKIFKNEEHSDRKARDKSQQEFLSNLVCYSVLILLATLIALVFSKDFATLIFVLFSLLLILTINFKRFVNFLKNLTSKQALFILLSFTLVVVVFSVYLNINFTEKTYRATSSLYFPDNEAQFNRFPNIESSRETIAGQIFLLNSIPSNIKTNFNTVILPEAKNVFFSDYAVMWSFKIGGWLWFLIYLGVLLMLSYTVISLIIIFSKPFKLNSGKNGYYDKKIVFGLNLLLAILLIQYIYTFLTNFWTIPLTGQSPGLLSPAKFEYAFHIILINYLYAYLVTTVEYRKIQTSSDENVSLDTTSYVHTKRSSLIVPLITFGISLMFLFFQRSRIDAHLEKNGGKMSWTISQENNLDSLLNVPKDTLISLAYQSFEKMKKNAEEGRKFTNYLSAYYQSNNNKTVYSINKNYILKNTNIDSLTSIKSNLLFKGENVFSYSKFVNGSPTLFINNKYYSGYPPNAETINYELQGILNKFLENWSKKIDAKKGYKMVGGSIIVAENENGHILASASYPFMYNENLYHVLYENEKMNDTLRKYKIDKDERIKIRFDNPSYTNFSDHDLMPGSIVKPLLAYCGLKYLPNNYPQEWLNDFLGWSKRSYASEMFNDLFIRGNYFNEAKSTYKNDFGFMPYTPNYELITTKFMPSHAIGQQQKISFRNVVQSYIRIKTNKRINLTYKKNEDLRSDTLSISLDQLKRLRISMCALRDGTAESVGKTLINKHTDISSFLAKTGTAQIGKNENYNRTSAIIIVGDHMTIGIQLYGVVPNNDDGLSAQFLCNQILSNNIVKLR